MAGLSLPTARDLAGWPRHRFDGPETANDDVWRPPSADTILADCGHPNWPGWRALLIALTVATLAAAFTHTDMLRPRARPGRPPVVRIWRRN